MSELRFTVYGKPEPQGSTRAFMPKGKKWPTVTSDNPDVRAWRERIGRGALMAMLGPDIWVRADAKIPLGIEVTFVLAKPKSVPKLRLLPAVKPDVDKLIRAVGDALTSIAYHDDSQICEAVIRKVYGAPERVEIRLWRIQ